MPSELKSLKLRDLVLLIIDRCGERPEFGRTALQKIAYFAAVRFSLDTRHSAHYYGPFSHAIERELEALSLSDFIEERVRGLGFANRVGLEAKKYEYQVTATGKERLQEIERTRPDIVKELDSFLSSIETLAGGFDQGILSTAAKTLYIAREKRRPLSVNEVSDLAREHDWRVSPTEIGRVFDLLEGLGFIKSV